MDTARNCPGPSRRADGQIQAFSTGVYLQPQQKDFTVTLLFAPDRRAVSLRYHFKDHSLIIPVDFFQSRVLRSDFQEIPVIEIGVDVAGVKCGRDDL